MFKMFGFPFPIYFEVDVRQTRCFMLRAFCVIYLTAFLSFYIQKPGLYGDNGVLPAKAALENSKYKTFPEKLRYEPTLLWLAPYLGLDTNYAIDVLALLGAFLAFTGFISQSFCTCFLFGGLWSLYFSLTRVGQVFMTNECDEFLLEAGFVAIFAAPMFRNHTHSFTIPADDITFWLFRWVLFRFLLTNGVNKLISGGPSWWNLTALTRHFEVMPLPMPLAWYAHHLPHWFLKLSQVYTNVCEIGLPFLFFLPIRSLRYTGFFFQFFLQVCIALTGNFGFSNLLLITLSFSLLDDDFGNYRMYSREPSFLTRHRVGQVANIVIHAAVIYLVIQLYSLEFKNGQILSNIAFTKSQFDTILAQSLIYIVPLVGAGLVFTYICTFFVSMFYTRQRDFFYSFIPVFYCTFMSVGLFLSSTVPLKSLNSAANSTTDQRLRPIYVAFNNLNIVNQYGLVSKMPETAGRSEIIFEGAKDVDGPWHEINFLFKPGKVNSTFPLCAPHTPRLDWQMSEAAYSTYDKQPWLISFAHRILNHEQGVRSLIDFRDSAFRQAPPKYLRAVLYNYQYTPWSKRNERGFWTRQRVSEYMPAFTKDSDFLIEFLKARNLLPTPSKIKVNPLWKEILDTVRYVINHLEATLLYWSVITAGFAIICTSSTSRPRTRTAYPRVRKHM